MVLKHRRALMRILQKPFTYKRCTIFCLYAFIFFIVSNVFLSILQSYFKPHKDLILESPRAWRQTYVEKNWENDTGSGCRIPKLNPFSPEIMQFDKHYSKITCPGTDWVKCYLSECRVVDKILAIAEDVECTYKDVIHVNDTMYILGKEVTVRGSSPYVLTKSDHARVSCRMAGNTNHWSGHVIGFRRMQAPKPPKGREHTYNVLLLAFDSTSKNTFIRKMPKSYKFLTQKLKANVLNGYGIVGDGTPAALLPILTGHTELELPEARRYISNSTYMDSMPFIFYKLKDDGYRTAYFEDTPRVGTFQYRLNGFQRQPADHYLRSFYLDVNSQRSSERSKYCVGDRPQFKLMLDITHQFLKQDGKRFCLTLIADISHDDINMLGTADDDVEALLWDLKAQGHLKDTLLMVMGDHGPRYANVRNTYQGKLEERLPLMAVVLPDELKAARPEAQRALKENEEVLTTPHDIHATLLDVMDLRHHWNPHKVKGADLKRGLTLLEPIPRSRSCSEADVDSHWCICLRWTPMSLDDPVYLRAAEALVKHLNDITEEERSQCVPRVLSSIQYVMREQVNRRVLTFVKSADKDGYVPFFEDKAVNDDLDNYQVKITVSPRRGLYEALVTHNKKKDIFVVNTREISRTNAYGNEPSCLNDKKPHLNMFCFCKTLLE